MRTLTVSARDVFKGPLILVNSQHPIKLDAPIRLTALDESGDILLEIKAASLLHQLFESIQCQARIVPVSGYRSRTEQKTIYDNSLCANGKAFTKKYIALPDCSEHQTGLAVDLAESSEHIDFLRPSFPSDGICSVFRNQAAKYGFIERYGKDKEAITGIAHEPWHYRYVGYPHSMIMQENHISFEEYITFIKAYPYKGYPLAYRQTEIFYVDSKSASQGLTLPEDCAQISGNNVDGFIVTIWRRSL
jgi:D-alanyl-D-alanine dipeptidase/carboxypeptidase